MLNKSPSNVAERIVDLRAELRRLDLDALIVPRYDAHQGEYVAPRDERLAFLTGFTGSAGTAIVTADQLAMFVDGRYTVQLLNQCPGSEFERLHLFEQPPENWIDRHAQEGWRIGFDPFLLPPTWMDRFKKSARRAGAALVPLEDNPIDRIWKDQPAPPMGKISAFPSQFSGRSSVQKNVDLTAWMAEKGATHLIETQPDNIAWFLNVRGDDVPFNPMPQSFMLVGADGQVTWFVDCQKFEEGLEDSLPNSLSIRPMDAFLGDLERCIEPGELVVLDPDFSPSAATLVLERIGARVLRHPGRITMAKAWKNPTECEGMRACHVQDGVAWTEFSAWLFAEVPTRAAVGNPVTEFEAEEKVQAYRQERPDYLSDSFRSISASAGNAAMCHYSATADGSVPISPDGTYLLDSGGQYETGTTDATRSFAFGPVDTAYRRAYTAVFKAFHAIATLRFPVGTQGHHIDAICRRPLWDLGLDYDHGTGHGIGHRLSVHEHPQRIGKPHNPVDLAQGMILSIEPGYYEAGRFGIRLENLFEVVEFEDGFLGFDNLTWIPIQTDMLDTKALSSEERAWLNAYHAKTLERLHLHLSDRALTWAQSACRPI